MAEGASVHPAWETSAGGPHLGDGATSVKFPQGHSCLLELPPGPSVALYSLERVKLEPQRPRKLLLASCLQNVGDRALCWPALQSPGKWARGNLELSVGNRQEGGGSLG